MTKVIKLSQYLIIHNAYNGSKVLYSNSQDRQFVVTNVSQYMIVTASDFHCTLHDSPPLRTRDDLRQFSLKNLKGFAELKVNFIQSEIIPGVIFAEERLEEEEDGRVEGRWSTIRG